MLVADEDVDELARRYEEVDREVKEKSVLQNELKNKMIEAVATAPGIKGVSTSGP